MAVSRFSRRVLVLIGFGIALPGLVLAGLGIVLTLRIGRTVQNEAIRYNAYMAQQVAEAFQQELLADIRRSIAVAENAARAGADDAQLRAALEAGGSDLGPAYVVPIREVSEYSMLVQEGQPLLFGPQRPGRWFAGLMLRGPRGQMIGAAGWLFSPGGFLQRHMMSVVQDRLPSKPTMYGGFERTRLLSVELFDPVGNRIANVREPWDLSVTHTEGLEGPFEGFRVRIGATERAPAMMANRFVGMEVGFIGLMGLVIFAATVFGVRYTVRQLELAQLKSGFVSNVTHEFKTPIALIRLAVETLEMRRVTSAEESQKFLATIARETTRLSQLVDNILDFARLEAGQTVFRLEPVDLAHVVREAVEHFRPRLDPLGFKVEVEIADDLPKVRGDERALSHCVLNLLDNAMKYSRGRKELRVSAGARGGRVTVSVADRGIGISPRDQKRVFEKFVRLETGLVHDVKGAGLGLSLVEQIMRAHGGRVELVSTAGEGSTFTLVLPAAEGVVEAARLEPGAQTGS